MKQPLQLLLLALLLLAARPSPAATGPEESQTPAALHNQAITLQAEGADKLPQAILLHRRSLLLDPRLPGARQSLDAALALAGLPPEPATRPVDRLLRVISLNEATLLAALLLWPALLGLAIARLSRRPALRTLGAAAAFSLGLLAVTAAAAAYTLATGPYDPANALVTATDAALHELPSDPSKVIATLPPATPVRILADRGSFLHIALTPPGAPPLQGFIRPAALTPIVPPDQQP